jgi:glutathione-regulated potassium-efflux system protein KefB
VNAEFPLAKLIVRSYDREHALYLSKKNVSLMVRETFESALALGQMALQ